MLYAQSTGTVISGWFCTRRRSGEETEKFQFHVDIVAKFNAVCEVDDFVFNPFEDGQPMKRSLSRIRSGYNTCCAAFRIFCRRFSLLAESPANCCYNSPAQKWWDTYCNVFTAVELGKARVFQMTSGDSSRTLSANWWRRAILVSSVLLLVVEVPKVAAVVVAVVVVIERSNAFPNVTRKNNTKILITDFFWLAWTPG